MRVCTASPGQSLGRRPLPPPGRSQSSPGRPPCSPASECRRGSSETFSGSGTGCEAASAAGGPGERDEATRLTVFGWINCRGARAEPSRTCLDGVFVWHLEQKQQLAPRSSWCLKKDARQSSWMGLQRETWVNLFHPCASNKNVKNSCFWQIHWHSAIASALLIGTQCHLGQDCLKTLETAPEHCGPPVCAGPG